jgi:hypothetical protein
MVFDFIRNFNNYGPKDFKGKSVKEILELKSNKVPDNFFKNDYKLKYVKEFAEANLSQEQLGAIQLLSDLRDKTIIFEKCYNKSGSRSHSIVPGHHSVRPAAVARAAPVKVEEPAQEPEPAAPEPAVQEEDERELVPEQTGGRSKRSRSKRSRSKRSRSKRSTSRSKRSRSKRSRSTSSTKKSKRSSRKHKGGGSPIKFSGITAQTSPTNLPFAPKF